MSSALFLRTSLSSSFSFSSLSIPFLNIFLTNGYSIIDPKRQLHEHYFRYPSVQCSKYFLNVNFLTSMYKVPLVQGCTSELAHCSYGCKLELAALQLQMDFSQKVIPVT